MTKIDSIALKLLPFIIVLIALVCAILSFANPFVKKITPTQRATYQDITKVEIRYPWNNPPMIYNLELHSRTINAIVNDINSLSYGKWRESLGGKEASSAVSIYLYSHTDTLVASFSLHPDLLQERAADYRQLNAQGFYREINIRQLPALKNVWCDLRNTYDYSVSKRGKYCATIKSF